MSRGLPLVGLALVVATLPTSGAPLRNVTVRVNGRLVALGDPATARQALARARTPWPRDGRLLAVASGRVLDPHWDPGTVRWTRRRLRPSSRLRDGSKLVVRDGVDAVEATRPIEDPIPAAGLPPIEYNLWNPGTPGLGDDVIGLRSGEVVRRSVLRGPVAAAPVPGRVVALTFDDGPDPRFTPAVLAILREGGVKAAFCVIGHWARRHPELLQAIRADGHVLCDHTETHPALDRIPGEQVAGQLAAPVEYCRLVTGEKPGFFRAPYGATTAAVLDAARAQGLRVLQWSVDPQDWTRPGVTTIVGRVLKQLHPGAIVLMHDGGGDRSETVAALPVIISALRAQGYTFAQPLAS
jgi:peptidoglycan-N-acetylglucosamine deacetylase